MSTRAEAPTDLESFIADVEVAATESEGRDVSPLDAYTALTELRGRASGATEPRRWDWELELLHVILDDRLLVAEDPDDLVDAAYAVRERALSRSNGTAGDTDADDAELSRLLGEAGEPAVRLVVATQRALVRGDTGRADDDPGTETAVPARLRPEAGQWLRRAHDVLATGTSGDGPRPTSTTGVFLEGDCATIAAARADGSVLLDTDAVRVLNEAFGNPGRPRDADRAAAERRVVTAVLLAYTRQHAVTPARDPGADPATSMVAAGHRRALDTVSGGITELFAQRRLDRVVADTGLDEVSAELSTMPRRYAAPLAVSAMVSFVSELAAHAGTDPDDVLERLARTAAADRFAVAADLVLAGDPEQSAMPPGPERDAVRDAVAEVLRTELGRGPDDDGSEPREALDDPGDDTDSTDTDGQG